MTRPNGTTSFLFALPAPAAPSANMSKAVVVLTGTAGVTGTITFTEGADGARSRSCAALCDLASSAAPPSTLATAAPVRCAALHCVAPLPAAAGGCVACLEAPPLCRATADSAPCCAHLAAAAQAPA